MLINRLLELFIANPIISTDSRKITEGCIFFALKGENFDGNRFALQAIADGAKYAVVSDLLLADEPNCIYVNDTLLALQLLAKAFRQTLSIPFIIVSGSNGKTTTKELLAASLGSQLQVFATPGNLNNHIGVPLSILQIKSEHQVAVLEIGSNHHGETKVLCDIIQPTHGIITNIGKDHLEGFGSIEGVAREYSVLFQYLNQLDGTAFVNTEEPYLPNMARTLKNKVTYPNSSDTVHLQFLTFTPTITFQVAGNEAIYTSHLMGKHNAANIATAMAVCQALGLDLVRAATAAAAYSPTNMRSQWVEGQRNRIWLDAYNANPSSMLVAIDTFSQIASKKLKVLILGDMLELGEHAQREHEALVAHVLDLGDAVDAVYFVGQTFGSVAQAHAKLQFVESTSVLKERLMAQPVSGQLVLLKGSRGIRLEQLIEVL